MKYRSPHGFLIEPLGGRLYNDKSKSGLILGSSIEDHKTTKREARVVALPFGYDGDISIGDIVCVHHNVFRKYYNLQAKEVFSGFAVKNGLYLVDYFSMFAFCKDGEWKTIGDYVFVKAEDSSVAFTNDSIQSVSKGDIVSFPDYCKYEFRIDDIIYYKMSKEDLCLKKEF